MIRLVLVLIGVAFCLLSSLTTPAHATPVLVSLDDTHPDFLPAGVVNNQDSTGTIIMSQSSFDLPQSPDLCISGNG